MESKETKNRISPQGVVVLTLSLAVILTIIGLVIFDVIPRNNTEEDISSTIAEEIVEEENPDAEGDGETDADADVKAQASEEENKVVLPPVNDPAAVFTIPESIIGTSAIAASASLQSLAPGVTINFIDETGQSIQATAQDIVISSSPAVNAETSSTGSITLTVSRS